jgi:hypothetical protein
MLSVWSDKYNSCQAIKNGKKHEDPNWKMSFISIKSTCIVGISPNTGKFKIENKTIK